MPEIDVAMPTWNSGSVIEGSLDHLRQSEGSGTVDIDRLIVVDKESDDDTLDIARESATDAGWEFEPIVSDCSLPGAREAAIDTVETEWFLFLDDDVRVDEGYLDCVFGAVAPLVGGVQGRKGARTEHPTDWVRRRSRRGGTHATLLRRNAVADVTFPRDLAVLEDEYLRRHVEDGGFLWVYNHQARFDHDSQQRHPIGWKEGYLGGKYELSALHDVALNVPYALASGRNPLPHAKRLAGWIAGWTERTR